LNGIPLNVFARLGAGVSGGITNVFDGSLAFCLALYFSVKVWCRFRRDCPVSLDTMLLPRFIEDVIVIRAVSRPEPARRGLLFVCRVGLQRAHDDCARGIPVVLGEQPDDPRRGVSDAVHLADHGVGVFPVDLDAHCSPPVNKTPEQHG
jgi:hypothetical protein